MGISRWLQKAPKIIQKLQCSRKYGTHHAKFTPEYLENPNFTLANMLLGHILYRYRNINFSREAFPSLRRHYEASTSMPAFRRRINIR